MTTDQEPREAARQIKRLAYHSDTYRILWQTYEVPNLSIRSLMADVRTRERARSSADD